MVLTRIQGSIWNGSDNGQQISIKDFATAVIGDGVIDDTTAINAAVTASSAGDNIYYPAGTYLISSAITMKTGVGHFSDGATIKLADGSNSNMFLGDGASDVTVRGLIFDGNKANNTTTTDSGDGEIIFFTDTSNTTQVSNNHVIDCEINNSSESGVAFGANLQSSVRGCRINNNRLHGIACVGGAIQKTELCVFANNIVEGNDTHSAPSDGGAGIIPMGTARRCLVVGNTIRNTGPNGDGITCYSDDNVGMVITGNVVENSHNHGIHVGGDDTVVSGNTVTEHGLTSTLASGILVESQLGDTDSLRITISGNNVNTTTAGAGPGIDLQDRVDTCTVVGNTVRNTGGIGIRLDDGGHVVVSGNTVVDSGTTGILCNAFIRCVISGNLVKDSDQDGIELIAGDQSLISGNMVFNSGVSVGGGTGFALKVDATTDRTIIQGNSFRDSNETKVTSIASGTTDVIFENNFHSDGSVNQNIETVASATTTTLPPQFDTFSISGTTTITSITASWEGRRVTLIFEGVLTLTDGSNMRMAGNFVTTGNDTITLISDGALWYEQSRSTN